MSSAANASFVGANTVNGPVPDKVGPRSAAVTASTRMLNCAFACAVCTMFSGAGCSSSLPPHAESATTVATANHFFIQTNMIKTP